MGFGIASFLIFQNLPVIFYRLCWSSHGSVSPTQQGLRRTGILPRPIELEVRSIYVYIYIYIYMYVCMNKRTYVRTYVCIWSWLMCRSCSYWTSLFVLRQPESSDNQRGISSMLNPSDSQDYKHGEQWTDLFPDFSLAGLQNWDIHQQQWVQSGKGTAIDLNWFPVKRGGLSSQPYVLTKWQFWSDINIWKK